MYHLAQVFPSLRERRLPFTRDQVVLALAAVNQIFLAVDIYLAHNLNQKIQVGEWIPIVFGLIAGVLLLLAGWVAIKFRAIANWLASSVFVASAVVGLLGVWFHLERAGLPAGDIGDRLSTRLLVWGPPFLGPLMFVVVALWGLSAAWVEDPADSGRLRFFRDRTIDLPLPKTDVYFLLVGTAAMVATISAVLDHARTGFEANALWIPTLVGVFAAVVCWAMAALRPVSRHDAAIFFWTMMLMVATGLLGVLFHLDDNLTSRGVVVAERFVRGAPIMAPLLYANVGVFGIVTLMNPARDQPGVEVLVET